MRKRKSQEDEFLNAVLASPEDDGPRLAYADWLSNRGDPRGEFIRIQCQLTRMAAAESIDVDRNYLRPTKDKVRLQLDEERFQLWCQYEKEWTEPLRELRCIDCTFQRGFVMGVEIGVKDFLEHGDELRHRAPVEHVVLVNFNPRPRHEQIKALAKCAGLDGIKSLWLRNAWMDAQDARTLARSPYLRNLITLNIQYQSQVGGIGAKALLASRRLPSLRSLWLDGNNIDADAAKTIAQEPGLARLSELRIGHNEIGDSGIKALAESPFVTNLTVLHAYPLPDTTAKITSRGIRTLAASRHLARLKILNLTSQGIYDPGAIALAKARHLSHLTTLILCQTHIGNEGAAALIGSARMPCLKGICLAPRCSR
jgi:uncharacterized protein (TIGR02996 family)